MRYWTFAKNLKNIPLPGILPSGVEDPYKRYYIPYKEIVSAFFLPANTLIDFDKYLNFTVKIFLNYFIEKKFNQAFPEKKVVRPLRVVRPRRPPRIDHRYLFQIPDIEFLANTEKKQFGFILKKIHTALDHYYKNYTDRSGSTTKLFQDPDLLGKIYNEISYSDRRVKKNKGQFFSPAGIVKSMVKEGMDFFKKKGKLPEKILDPAGGAGVFLNRIFQVLKKELISQGLTKEKASQYLLDKVIWGVDLDPIAAFLMKINLAFLSQVPGLFPKNIFTGDFIFKEKNPQNVFNLNHITNIKFDWIIGNPPWGSRLNESELKEIRNVYKISQGEINSFSAFLEHSITLLHQGGLLSKLLPESLLNIRVHKIIRKFILDETKIINIHLLGDIFKNVFAPAIQINIQKQFMSSGSVIRLEKSFKKKKVLMQEISQEKFRQNPHFIFSVYSTATSENLMNLIKKGRDTLHNHARFYMGIVTGNNAMHVYKYKYHEKAEKIINGKDVFPFYIRPSSNWIYFQSKMFQQACQESHFRMRDKLIYKFISNELKFAIEREKRLHINSVNGFYLETDCYSPEFLQTLLNSKLINFYFRQHFFPRRILRGDLEMVPIMIPSQEVHNHISSLCLAYEKFLEKTRNLTQGLVEKQINLQKPNHCLNYNKEKAKSKKIVENSLILKSGVNEKNLNFLKEIEIVILDLYKIPSYLRESIIEKIS